MDSLELNINGQVIVLTPKTFSTGSKGYHGAGKVYIDSKKHQANFMLIEVGSKPGSEKPAKPAKK
jgi:hypothetical protein